MSDGLKRKLERKARRFLRQSPVPIIPSPAVPQTARQFLRCSSVPAGSTGGRATCLKATVGEEPGARI